MPLKGASVQTHETREINDKPGPVEPYVYSFATDMPHYPVMYSPVRCNGLLIAHLHVMHYIGSLDLVNLPCRMSCVLVVYGFVVSRLRCAMERYQRAIKWCSSAHRQNVPSRNYAIN